MLLSELALPSFGDYALKPEHASGNKPLAKKEINDLYFFMQEHDKHPLTAQHLRISTKEIDDAVHQLQIAFGDGRLDENDFDERMKKALLAKTRGELSELFVDLEIQSQPLSKEHYRLLRAKKFILMSSIEHKGKFVLPKNYQLTAVMGSVVLDLREARLESNECEIHITSLMSGVEIIVPKGIRIELHGMPLLGAISQQASTEELTVESSVIHIHGKAILGAIDIR